MNTSLCHICGGSLICFIDTTTTKGLCCHKFSHLEIEMNRANIYIERYRALVSYNDIIYYLYYNHGVYSLVRSDYLVKNTSCAKVKYDKTLNLELPLKPQIMHIFKKVKLYLTFS